MHFVEEVVRQKAPVRAMNAPATASRAPTKRKRINYNIAALQNAIEQQNTEQDNDEDNDESERHVALELKKANRRFEELDRENFSEIHKFEIPKNLGPSTNKRASTPSVAVKRILNSKKNWSNYTDELDKAEMRALNGLEIKPGQTLSTKEIGTSAIVKPNALALTIISIWKTYPFDLVAPMIWASTSFLYNLNEPVKSDTCGLRTTVARKLAPRLISFLFKSQP